LRRAGLLDGIGHIMGIVRPFRLEKVLDITDETCPYSTLFLKSVPLSKMHVLLVDFKEQIQ